MRSLANPVPLLLFAGLALLPVAGCAVGPDFKKPAAAGCQRLYGRSRCRRHRARADVAGGEAQSFAKGADIAADWWTLFHSRPLNDLIAQSLANNPDLKAAQAALRWRSENALAQRGVFYPKLAAGFSATRHQDPPGALAPVPSTNAFQYNLFTPQLSISYMPDVSA